VGDVRVLGKYQSSLSDPAEGALDIFGVNFGLKLPTGQRDLRNREGAVAERSLQPGTGTTDLLIGGFFSRVLVQRDSSWFAQFLLQNPLDSRDHYRPGRRLSVDLGYRYELSANVGLMMQLNALVRGRDRGSQAEPDDSGGRFVYLSPGIGYSISRRTQLYGFVQLPVYQHVNGVQLVSDWSAVLGVTTRF
jgi:hypothetical protein